MLKHIMILLGLLCSMNALALTGVKCNPNTGLITDHRVPEKYRGLHCGNPKIKWNSNRKCTICDSICMRKRGKGDIRKRSACGLTWSEEEDVKLKKEQARNAKR